MLLCAGFAAAQEVTLTARVALTQTSDGKTSKSREAGNVMVWLTPAAGTSQAGGVYRDAAASTSTEEQEL